jgi:hypothetical protein
MALTLYQIEESYRDQVNFVMVNGDDPNNWPLIDKLGVDAIPHLALLEADGTVDTALIGPVPKEWLTQDLDVLIENAKNDWSDNDVDDVVPPIACQPTLSTTTEITMESSPMASTTTNLCAVSSKRPLPYQMLDVFANRPASERRITGSSLTQDINNNN